MILVTGGTGFVGRDVVRELVARGYPVRVLARNSVRALKAFPREKVQCIAGDVRDAASLDAAMVGVSAVIHLVGIISERRGAGFAEMHTGATQNVVEAMRRTGVKRLVHMSALGTRPHARARYHQSKWAAEEIVRGSGLAWTIFRPSIIYGRGDHLVNLFAKLTRWPFDLLQLYSLPVLGGGESRMQPVAVQDVSHCFVAALADQRALGRTLDVCGSEVVTFAELLEMICRVRGHETQREGFPVLLLLRHLAWATTFYSGIFLLVLGVLGHLTLGWAIFLMATTVLAGTVAWTWRTMLLFPVPMPLLLTVGWTLDHTMADWERDLLEKLTGAPMPSLSQMQMLEEDNVGDAAVARSLFGIQSVSLEQGLRRAILGDGEKLD